MYRSIKFKKFCNKAKKSNECNYETFEIVIKAFSISACPLEAVKLSEASSNKLIEFPNLFLENFSFKSNYNRLLSTGALAYAELGTMNTSSGAEWAYFMDAFGSAPAFIFSWVSTLVLKPSQMAIICLSFAQYAVEAFVSECDPPSIVVKMVALLAIGEWLFLLLSSAISLTIVVFSVCILFVNCYSVNLGMAVQNIFASAKMVAVLIVICGGAWKLFQGKSHHFWTNYEVFWWITFRKYSTSVQRIQQWHPINGRHCDCLLHRFVGIRWVEQLELRHRRNSKPEQVRKFKFAFQLLS